MFAFSAFSLLSLLAVHVHAHASIQHPSMYGFNVTQTTFPFDNRAVAPLMNLPFNQWWFHGHLDYPPNPGDFFELPAGKPATSEIACDKGATSYFTSNPGGDVRDGNNPCPKSPLAAIHTTGLDDLTGCALAIAYKSDVNQVQPEDFVVFSVNHTCVWTRFTDFQVPADMPPCPPGGCHCAWFWIHSPDSGNEQNYMTGFKCNVTGSTSNVPLATPKVPRRCGADPANGVPKATPGNCTYGAKSPFYWFQAERNNMFEGDFSPPLYTDLYNFRDGAQDDIFEGYYESIPPPGPNQTALPQPRNQSNNTSTPPAPSSSTPSPTPSSSTPSSTPSPSPSPTPSLSPSNGPSSNPSNPSPTPSPTSPPASTDTTPGFTVLLPSTDNPAPSPSSQSNPGTPGNVIDLNKRQPMPMKRMMSTASNLKRRHWGSRRSMLYAKMRT